MSSSYYNNNLMVALNRLRAQASSNPAAASAADALGGIIASRNAAVAAAQQPQQQQMMVMPHQQQPPLITISSTTSTKRTSTTVAAPPTTPRTVASEEDSEEEEEEATMPWQDHDFVPVTKSGKQKTPNMIRNELQRYIDSKAETQTAIVQEMGVNNNSFRRFMNPKTYKNQWSAVENGTYWAAGRLLARVQHEQDQQKKKKQSSDTTKKRKTNGGSIENFFGPTTAAKKVKTSSTKSAAEKKAQAEEWMTRVMATPVVAPNDITIIYDSCPQLVKKIKDCLTNQEGMTKAAFCRIALEGANANMLSRFLAAKKQDQQASMVYKRAFAFFEKLRIMTGQAKTKERLKNEQEQGREGFSTALITRNTGKYVILTASEFLERQQGCL